MSATHGTRQELTERGTRAAYEMFQTGKFTTLDIARLMGVTEASIYNGLHHYREERQRAAA